MFNMEDHYQTMKSAHMTHTHAYNIDTTKSSCCAFLSTFMPKV